MHPIQMVDLTTQYRKIEKEINETLREVLASGQYIQGNAVRQFAEELAAYTGAKQVIPCANGTDALQIALMSLGLEEGDEVIVPAFTYVATAEAIALLKLCPVLVDVDPLTFNLDPARVEEALSPRTRAMVPVHLFGQSCDMEPLLSLARKHHLKVIEDNAQSIGAVYTFSDGTQKQTGTMGDIGTLSFFPTKNLGCYGDGGALLTDDEAVANRLRMIASHGQSKKYYHEIIGCNSRLDTLQAAILRIKLSYLDQYANHRRQAAQWYEEGLSDLSDRVLTPRRQATSTQVYHQYTLQVLNGQRDGLQAFLRDKGIPTMIYYPQPLHQQPAFRNILRVAGKLDHSIALCKSVLSLPMHTELTKDQVDYITEQIRQYEYR